MCNDKGLKRIYNIQHHYVSDYNTVVIVLHETYYYLQLDDGNRQSAIWKN